MGNMNQLKLEKHFEMSAMVMEQVLKDQQVLAKQMEMTGQAVAQLTMNLQAPQTRFQSRGARFVGDFQYTRARPSHQRFTHRPNRAARDRDSTRHHWPKMAFPRFDGSNPTIWKDKCMEYFHLFNNLESMWTTLATLHMDEIPSKWLKVYKAKYGLGSWSGFISTVEKKFGANNYREAIEELLELQQSDRVEVYVRI